MEGNQVDYAVSFILDPKTRRKSGKLLRLPVFEELIKSEQKKKEVKTRNDSVSTTGSQESGAYSDESYTPETRSRLLSEDWFLFLSDPEEGSIF